MEKKIKKMYEKYYEPEIHMKEMFNLKKLHEN